MEDFYIPLARSDSQDDAGSRLAETPAVVIESEEARQSRTK